MRHFRLIICLVSACFLILASCVRSETSKLLDQVESYIRQHPDSALTVLERVDHNKLDTRELCAHFSLLYTMALDKNYIDTTDLSVIQPAVDYYSKYGSSLEKMKSYYYQGCIYFNRNELNQAMTSYLKALEDSSVVHNAYYKQLVNSALSDVFALNHNDDLELYYAKTALKYGALAKDSIGVWAISGHIASCYADLKMWRESEKEYRHFFEQTIYDSLAYYQRKIFYAKNFILGPDQDADKCIAILDDVIKSYPRAMTVEGYCMYAYAQQQKGNSHIADRLITQLETLNRDHNILQLWRYRILRNQKKFDRAIVDLEQSVIAQDSIVIAVLRQSLLQTQSDFFQLQNLSLKKDNHIKKLHVLFLLVISFLVIGILAIVYYRKKAFYNSRISELSELHREAQLMISLQNQAAGQMSAILRNKEESLLLLRKQFAVMFKAQFKSLNDLCAAFWSPIKKDRKDIIYEEVKKLISIIGEDKESHNKFISLVNKSLDNIIDKLRNDLPDNREEDFILLVFVIAGFDAKTISTLTGYSVGTVYTKKNRLKNKIYRLSSPYRDFYLEYIS